MEQLHSIWSFEEPANQKDATFSQVLGARLSFQADFPVAMLILHLLHHISSA
jgi:hypothetical protein